MSLPIRITLDDLQAICSYLTTKPTGATLKETKAVVDKKHLSPDKLDCLKDWKLIEDFDGKLKITETGREYVKNDAGKFRVLTNIIRNTPPYLGIIERVAHRHEDTLTATEIAGHWADNFKDYVGGTDTMLNLQVLVFFQVASGTGLGNSIIGRKGQQTRFSFNAEAIDRFVLEIPSFKDKEAKEKEDIEKQKVDKDALAAPMELPKSLGQGIFIAHGKNKKPMEQLKKILDQFHLTYRVAVEEPNLGRPISGKVRDIMKSCNCAILIFSADEEFKDKNGNKIWRPSENVIYELGAAAFLYDNRIVIMKEEGVTFPTNFKDIGYISFDKDQLDAKTLDILKEMIGFGIIKVST